MDLSNLKPAEGSRQSDNFRRGRGHGSGNGKTAGKGHKGQKARSGASFISLLTLILALNPDSPSTSKVFKYFIAPAIK